jgi:PPOX class probable F420-dependent enzyme
MALRFGPRLRAFLGEVYPAVIGTARRDGTVAMTPVWFEYADGLIWLNGGPNRAWFKRVERTGKASLLMLDPKQMFRYARIEARLAGSATAGADDHIDRLSHRYMGGPYRNPKVDRLIVKLEPTSVTGMEMGQAWDVTEDG